MRKITQQSCLAFAQGNNFSKDNTVVNIYGSDIKMLLHGHEIASKSIEGLQLTLAGYPTIITRERLNGLLMTLGICGKFYQKNEKQFFEINGNIREISPNEIIKI